MDFPMILAETQNGPIPKKESRGIDVHKEDKEASL